MDRESYYDLKNYNIQGPEVDSAFTLAVKLGDRARLGEKSGRGGKSDCLVEATLAGGSYVGELLGEGEGSRLGEPCPKFGSCQDRVPTKSVHSSAPRAAAANTMAK